MLRIYNSYHVIEKAYHSLASASKVPRLRRTLLDLPSETPQLADALRRMTKPPLKDRIITIHSVKQLYEVNKYPRITRVQGTLSNAKHLGSNIKVLSIHPLSLEANFLLFRKHHLNHAGARAPTFFDMTITIPAFERSYPRLSY